MRRTRDECGANDLDGRLLQQHIADLEHGHAGLPRQPQRADLEEVHRPVVRVRVLLSLNESVLGEGCGRWGRRDAAAWTGERERKRERERDREREIEIERER